MTNRILQFTADSVIIHEGESQGNLYKILSGKIVLFKNYGKPSETTLSLLSAGKCFGEMGALCEQASIYTAVAFTDVSVMVIPKEELDEFALHNHHTMMEIIRDLGTLIMAQSKNIDMLLNDLQETVSMLQSKGDEPASLEQQTLISQLNLHLMQVYDSQYYDKTV